MRVTLAAVLLLVVSCQAPVGAPHPTTSSTTAPTTTIQTPPAVIELAPVSCNQAPPIRWALLCDAYTVLVTHHVGHPEPASLAAAAALGVANVSMNEDVGFGAHKCALPDPAFEVVCDEIEAQLIAGYSLETLVEAAVTGMFKFGLDPFSAYVPPDIMDHFDALGPGLVPEVGVIVGGRDGSGLACAFLSDGCHLVVLSVFPFSPADGAGALVGDIIVEIEGRAVGGLSLAEATAVLAGPPETRLQFTVEREDLRLRKTVVREDVRFEPVEFEMLSEDIAYLRLNEFTQTSAQLVGRALQREDVQRASSLILDLRNNLGGLVAAAQAVSSQFLDGGEVVVERRETEEISWPVIDGGLGRDITQLIVLANRGSASASEMVVAILQERGRAVVIGEPTFGKNLIQEEFAARNGGLFVVSVSHWTTPGGFDVGFGGIEPDIVVTSTPDRGGDPILEAALEYLSR